jgi:ABC-type molybdate transport system substrate-binding protein
MRKVGVTGRRPFAIIAIIGLIAWAVLSVPESAFAFPPHTAINVGAANNVYLPMQDRTMANSWAAMSGAAPFVMAATTQSGGFWRADDLTTTLRGITSGNLRKQLLGPGPYSAPGAACSTPTTACVYGPLQIDTFLSADEGNINQVLPASDIADGGTCVLGSGQGQGGETVTACPGVPGTKVEFTIGQLAIYSCATGWSGIGANPGSPGNPLGADGNNSGNGVPTSPNCKAAPISPAVTTVSGVVAWLNASSSHKLSIAAPASAPFGVASKQALINAGFPYDDSSGTAAQNAWTSGTQPNHCEGTLPTGAVCKIRLESGITQVRGAVTSGTVQLGLLSVSSVKKVFWTSGTTGGPKTLRIPSLDPNVWTIVPESAYTIGGVAGTGRIKQFAVVIRRSPMDSNKEAAASSFLTWVRGVNAQNTLASYGYLPTH